MKPRQRQAAILEYLQKQGNARLKNWRNTLTPQAQPFARSGHSGTCRNRHSYLWRSGVNKEESDPPIDHKTLINTHKKS